MQKDLVFGTSSRSQSSKIHLFVEKASEAAQAFWARLAVLEEYIKPESETNIELASAMVLMEEVVYFLENAAMNSNYEHKYPQNYLRKQQKKKEG